MTVVGHNTATIRESLLEKAFELGEKFIKASKNTMRLELLVRFAYRHVSIKT